jgi:hypothetical protein
MTSAIARFASSTTRIAAFQAFIGRHGKLARLVLYAYVVLIACPIRYWPLGDGAEDAWRFALNYAQVQGLTAGRDVIFTCGPLVYLLFPGHLGNNLAQGLLFQTALWLSVTTIFADLFFRADIALRNLAFFSLCFGMAAPLFWFNFLGTENLMLVGALILMLIFHLRGGLTRYLAALVLLGLLPMFKLTAGMVGLAALAGFLVERLIERRWKVLPEVALAAVVPAAVTTAVAMWLMPSASAIMGYLRGSAEITRGFSTAMSYIGHRIEIVSALEAITVLVILLWLHAPQSPKIAGFQALLIVIPLFISFKHGFVRQDPHIVNFFCFVAVALGLVSLTISLRGKSTRHVLFLMILFFMIWQDNVGRQLGLTALTEATGVKAAKMVWGVFRFDHLKQKLDSSNAEYPEDQRIEPELVKLIGDSPIASLSVNYTNLVAARSHLRLYPVVERYSAYTPYLDRLNASWIRDKGPRFLVFDGKSIDDRDPWAETPAMWLEIYRWYDTRLLGSRNVLLERRTVPRFTVLETIGRFRVAFPGTFQLPFSPDPIFWTMNCGQSIRGQVERVLFRVPSVFITIRDTAGVNRSARIIPELLVSPLLVSYFPGTLSQFAAVFHSSAPPAYSVDRIALWGPGSASYSSSCQVELLRAIDMPPHSRAQMGRSIDAPKIELARPTARVGGLNQAEIEIGIFSRHCSGQPANPRPT